MAAGSTVWRWVRNLLLVLGGGLVALTLVLVASGWVGFGQAATGARAERMRASPQYGDGVFTNPKPMWVDTWGTVLSMFRSSPVASPDAPVPVDTTGAARLRAPPASGLRVTWLGHSTLLIEIDGKRILTDPIFGERASPISWIGPRRWYPPPIALADLPPVDAVLISHDHPDHLQTETIQAIAGWNATFVAPLGVGAHLEYWGVPASRIVELDWWERVTIAGVLEVVSTPSHHASGRQVLDQNATLWTSYALLGPKHRAYFSGDTGWFAALDEIGARFGPFDVAMFEVGAYDRTWPDWHLGPEQAVRANERVRGRVFLPIHWGLWDLAAHGWTEPAERVVVAATEARIPFAIPKPGESIEPEALPPFAKWWPDLPWDTAAQHPIVSTQLSGEPSAAR